MNATTWQSGPLRADLALVAEQITAGSRVLDLGCGMGWFCRWAAENGAASVLGIDLSSNMLDRAHAMLKNREGRVSEIALRVGFGSEKHFSTVFKERFGVSPSQVRP